MPCRFLIDTAERALATYVQALLGLLLVADTLDLGAVKVAIVAAIPAGLAVVKAGIASQIGTKGSASLLPAQE